MSLYIGIDPGLSGGLAVVSEAGAVAELAVMPVEDGQVDGQALGALLWPHWPEARDAAVELVHAMPGQGVTSMFTFGRGLGVLMGVLGSMGIRVKQPSPQRWKKDILGEAFDHKDKAGTMAWCAKAYPAAQLIPPRCRVPHSGLADALALAEWCRRNH